jgi:hypothetical protein
MELTQHKNGLGPECHERCAARAVGALQVVYRISAGCLQKKFSQWKNREKLAMLDDSPYYLDLDPNKWNISNNLT